MNYIPRRKPGRHINDILAKKITLTGQTGWDTLWRGRNDIFTEQNDLQIGKMFNKVELVFACVRELATSLASLPLQAGEFTPDGFEPDDGTRGEESLALFYDNPWYSYGQIIELIVSRLSLHGASFTLLEQYKNRKGVARICPMPTQTTEIKSRGPEIIKYETATNEGGTMDLLPEEVCAHMYLNPSSYMQYMSPLQAAAKRLQIDIEQANMSAEMMVNQSLPGIVGRMKTQLKEEQIQQIKDQLHSSSGGENSSRGKLFLVPNQIEDLQFSAVKDIDQNVLSSLTESRICMVFGIPPILIGAKVGLDKATYANYAEARRSFYQETLLPLAHFIEDQFSRAIFKFYGEKKMEYRFDTSGLKELQQDIAAVAKQSVDLYVAGIIDRNEARVLNGFDADNDYEEPEPTPMPAPVAEPTQAAESTDEMPQQDEEVGKTAVPFLTAKATPVIDGFAGSKQLERELRKEFKRQKKIAMAQFKKAGLVDMAAVSAEFNPKVLDLLEREYMRIARENIRKYHQPENIENTWRVVNPLVKQQAENQFMQLSDATMQTTQKSVDEALKKTREALISEGVYGDNTIPALTRAVQTVFEDAEKWRAQRIAVTESARMSNDAEVLAAEGSDVVGWIPLVSSDACELCQVFDAQDNATGQPTRPFTSQDDSLKLARAGNVQEAYVNRKLPPFHPGCRCSKQPVFSWEVSAMALPPSGTVIPSQGSQKNPVDVPVSDLVE